MAEIYSNTCSLNLVNYFNYSIGIEKDIRGKEKGD